MAPLILRNPFLLGDPPGLFVKVGVEGELGEDRLGEIGDHGAVLLLFLDDFVEYASVVIVVIVGEEVLEFDFAGLEGLFLVETIRKTAEVKDGGAVVGFYQNRNVADAGKQAFLLDNRVHFTLNNKSKQYCTQNLPALIPNPPTLLPSRQS